MMEMSKGNLKPTEKELYWFGLIILVFFGVVGTLALFRFHAPNVAYTVWGLGLALTLFFYAARPFRLPIYLIWMHIFMPLGWLITHLVLVVLFYLVVTPVGLLMKLFRYDPLTRRPNRNATTYWVEHRTGDDSSRYLRQY